MVEGFEPIEPCEPIVPKPTPIEVVPGPFPTRPPLVQPSDDPLRGEDIPPSPLIGPNSESEPIDDAGGGDLELEPIGDAGGGDNPPPKGPTTGFSGDAADSDDDPEDDDDSLGPGQGPPPPPGPPSPPREGDGNDDKPPTKSAPKNLQRVQLRVAQCQFQPVDSISQYNSFRSGNSLRHRGRPFGIDISLDGYSCYVATLRVAHPGLNEKKYRRAAWDFIWNHQRFHYRVDCAVFALERAFDIASKPFRSSVWKQFHLLVGGSPNHCSALEESLSCAFALRQCKNPVSHDLTLTLVRKQPKAYQQQTDDGKRILTTGGSQKYQVATSQLLSRYLDLNLRSPFYAANLQGLLTDNNPFGWPLRPYLAR
jgi:hypothetical protein